MNKSDSSPHFSYPNTVEMAKIGMVTEHIQKAVEFLRNEQLDWGEFPTYGLSKDRSKPGIYIMSVFPTTFVLHALSFVEPRAEVKEIIDKSFHFLKENLEPPGVCRYYGKHASISPDLDDTSCVLASLIESGYKCDESLFHYLLRFRDADTRLFRTWMGPFPISENDIDSIVNANVLFLYGKAQISHLIPEVSSYLVAETLNLHVQNSQVWYHSPNAFAYMVSRAYSDGNVHDLQASASSLCEYLIFTQRSNGGWANALETGLATTALLNFSVVSQEVERAVEYLCQAQNVDDGSWPEEFFYVAGELGSKGLTTGICLEALAKYNRRLTI